MGLDTTTARDLDESYVAFYWQTYYQIATEPLNVWRNGIGIVVDLKGAGLANIGILNFDSQSLSALLLLHAYVITNINIYFFFDY